MPRKSTGLLKKLILRLDGAADSERVRFVSETGTPWEAELSLHSGTGPQAPHLLVMFRNRADPRERQRYRLLPPEYSKVPKEAAGQLTESELRELLATSVEV